MSGETSMTRREAMKVAGLGAGLGAASLASLAWAQQGGPRNASDGIRIGVIGAGGRGTGAAINALSIDPGARVVALADLFEDRVTSSRQNLANAEGLSERATVDPEKCFVGFDAYQKLLSMSEVNYVILATPPGFRPAHFEAAVNAGKHIFTEKPVAVDGPGIRRFMAAGALAAEKKLCVAAGTQRRHEACYLETMKRIGAGEIGEVVGGQVYWNMGSLWGGDLKPAGMTDMEWQCRNWLYHCWLSGDHIVEQHVHNIDVMNWAKGGHPVAAYGMGGRQVRTGPGFGNVFDHFAIELEYADGTVCNSYCRQTEGTDGRVQEMIVGTKGRSVTTSGSAYFSAGGKRTWMFRGENPNPYDVEHLHLMQAIRGESAYLNEAQTVAESTLTAIMGRMSAYTGKRVTWEQALDSQLDLTPGSMAMGDLAVGEVPVPGRTPLI